MSINTSVDHIYDFVNELGNAKDFCFFNMGGFESASSLILDKCSTLRLAGEQSFTKIQASISNANIAIDNNKKAIEPLKERLSRIRKAISSCEDDEERAKLKKAESNVEWKIDQVFKATASLENLVQQLYRKSDQMSRALSQLREVESSLSTVNSNLSTLKTNYTSGIENLINGSNNAMVYVKKIDDCLSYVANTSASSSKIICVKGPNCLFEMARSLNNTYKTIGDNDSDYARLLNGFTSVIQDEVSRGVAAKSQDMLNRFHYELKDFPTYSQKFNDAGNALRSYENLKI